MEPISLSADQQYALKEILGWYADRNKAPYLTLGGYAGTGKTTLIGVLTKEIIKIFPHVKIAFCSYTGRAAQNLKEKIKENGIVSANGHISTIHGLIYEPVESSSGRISGWSKKDSIAFHLIIVDEASMVDSAIWNDLLSYNVPVLAVGDHGQLPPINGSFNLMRCPDIKLENIYRQAHDNPIIALSEKARSCGRIEPGVYGPGVVKYLNSSEEAGERSGELLESYDGDTLILCGYNSTRVKINSFIRNSMGFELPFRPSGGDRVVCLRNNTRKNIYNGMLGTVIEINDTDDPDWYEAAIDMDGSRTYNGLIYAKQFNSSVPINFTEDRLKARKGDLFDFGYALTVHKAQGSQARRVILFEERFPRMDDEAWRRWLYTAVTRAEEELYIFGR